VEVVNADNLPPLGISDPTLPVTCLLWGDSHAMAASPAFDQFLKDRGIAGRQAEVVPLSLPVN
jgi:hypothetical protein